MSTSTDRKGDKSRRRKTREDNDEQTRDRDSTPRGFGHTRTAYQNLEESGGCANQYHLTDERSDSEDGGDDYGGSNSSEVRRSDSSSSWSNWTWATGEPKGWWWRSRKDQNGQLIYDYEIETQNSEPETTSSSSRHYTSVRGEASRSSQVAWQPNYIQSSGSGSLREQIRDEASTGYLTEHTSSQKSSVAAQASYRTDFGPIMNSQEDYSRQAGRFDDQNTAHHSSDPTIYEKQQITTNISEPNISARSSPLPPQFIPSPVLCRCELGENLCGVIIFPPQPLPKDGKVSSKRRKGKGSSSVSGTKGSGSGSGKLSVKGANGSGCGPLSLPGITPSPKPLPPAETAPGRDWDTYYQQLHIWEENYKAWKDITCPCGRGYFDEDGKWVSGGDVRNDVKPPNPRWASTNGMAPDTTSHRGKYKATLRERA